MSKNFFYLEQNATPSNDNDVSSKVYVDNVAKGLDIKDSVRAATTANIGGTYNNGTSGVGATITADSNGVLTAQDGVTLIATNRLLVKNQSDAGQNGIYVVTNVGAVGATYVLTRADDFDDSTNITAGAFTFVEEGTTNGDKGFVLTTNEDISVGVGGSDTDLTFTQFSGGLSAGSVDTNELASDAVTTAKIADNAVTLAKMAGITRGSIILGDSSGDPAELNAKTGGYILVGNGTDLASVEVTGDVTLAANGAVTIAASAVETSMIADDAVTLAKMANISQGSIIVGGGSNAPTALNAKTSGQILVGDGTDLASVAVSGDVTLAANGAVTIAASAVETGMIADDAVTLAKMANISQGSIIIGGGSNAPTALNAKTSGQILVGDGTDLASVEVTGDVTLAANGAVTIAASAVETSMIADNAVNGDKLADNITVAGTLTSTSNFTAKAKVIQEIQIVELNGSGSNTNITSTSGTLDELAFTHSNIVIDPAANNTSAAYKCTINNTSSVAGETVNIFYDKTGNSETLSLEIDFGADKLHTGSGSARYLTFNAQGQSASLVHIDASNDIWAIINTGAVVSS